MCKNTDKDEVQKQIRGLAEAFLTLRTVDEYEAFFADLLTSKEAEDISSRLEVARLLKLGVNYNDIAAATARSKSSIGHLFSEKMKITPKQYIL